MSSSESGPAQNKELVLRYIELLNADQIDAAHALVAEDAVFWFAGGPTGVRTMSKAERIAQTKEWLKRMATPVRYQVVSLTSEQDRTAVEATTQAYSHDGRLYDQRYFILFRSAEGMIRSVRLYFDTDLARRLLASGS